MSGQEQMPSLNLPRSESVLRDFLVRVDSYTSLVAYRHSRSGVPDDIVKELLNLSVEARNMYDPPRLPR